MIGKNSEPLAEIEPTTFQIPVARSNHWVKGDSHSVQVAGF